VTQWWDERKEWDEMKNGWNNEKEWDKVTNGWNDMRG
jgi:hypothetical protein